MANSDKETRDIKRGNGGEGEFLQKKTWKHPAAKEGEKLGEKGTQTGTKMGEKGPTKNKETTKRFPVCPERETAPQNGGEEKRSGCKKRKN